MSNQILKEYVQKLIELEEQEDQYKNIMSNIKKEKEIVNNGIMAFMEENKITEKDIIFGDKKIKYTSQKTTESITKKLIQERLTTFLKSVDMAQQATNYIYSDRNSNIKNFIKITNIKSES